MTTACIVTYNDYPLIKKCIESIYNKVDKIICVDGRYKDFPDYAQGWFSTDGTIEYLLSLPKVELRFAANLYEADKRSVYLHNLNDGEAILMIDSDEVLEGNIPPLNADIGLVRYCELKSSRGFYLATRFFKFRQGLHYSGIHFILETAGGKLFNNRCGAEPGFTSEEIKGFRVVHDREARDKNRKYSKIQYCKTLGQREAQYQKGNY